MKVTWKGLDSAAFNVLLIVPSAWVLGIIFLFVFVLMPRGSNTQGVAILSPAQLEGFTFAIQIYAAVFAAIGMAWALTALLYLVPSLIASIVVYLRTKRATPKAETATA